MYVQRCEVRWVRLLSGDVQNLQAPTSKGISRVITVSQLDISRTDCSLMDMM